MHDQGLRPFGRRLLDDGEARRHREYRSRDDRRAFHLQTVWTIILDRGCIEEFIQVADQVRRTDHLDVLAPHSGACPI